MRIRATLAALTLATAGLAAGAGSAAAAGDDSDATNASGNGASTSYGNSATAGSLSPQAGLVQNSLNDLCLGVPAKVNVGSLIGLIPITVQDVNVLANPQNQQCAENSTQNKGDDSLSHIVDDIPILSENGTGNGS
ncbi:RdlA protein [Streptomyces sp. Ru73]|uniref:rodlin n=1 Tax=Streptomyces sp. Ru73 TaxID=2080748 RepID=UPI000CDD73C5|nr:rodlin [Streptomyces sp. Ru73]POX38023.1 RdlA protein [Streptomyces sp. Ru73]